VSIIFIQRRRNFFQIIFTCFVIFCTSIFTTLPITSLSLHGLQNCSWVIGNNHWSGGKKCFFFFFFLFISLDLLILIFSSVYFSSYFSISKLFVICARKSKDHGVFLRVSGEASWIALYPDLTLTTIWKSKLAAFGNKTFQEYISCDFLRQVSMWNLL